VAAALALTASGCPGGGPRGADGTRSAALPAGSVPADTGRFPHALHTGGDPRIRGFAGRGLGCTDCHPRAAVMAGKAARPGSDQHAPCDRCHEQEFYRPPGAFCRVCHAAVDPRRRGAARLQPYPVRGFRRVLASRFSHEAHLDRARMERAAGFHVDCGDCHPRDARSRDPALPGHAECARCHGAKRAAVPPRAPCRGPDCRASDGTPVGGAMGLGECAACHPPRDVELVRGRLLITGDLVFAHATHERDARGRAIPCRTCHADVPGSGSAEDVSVPPMQRCAICHEDGGRTPDRVRIARCEVCHRRIASGRPPASHMVGGSKELPEDHTIQFRRDHADQAGDPAARCRFCHEGLSGAPRDSCFQCHERMRPRDHGLAWREDDHGHEATVDRERCAACHQADYCTACHSVPPRSHQPFEAFRLGGHAEAARFELTSCMACHTFQDTCADCHRGTR
jgi:hypothetical protein